MMRKNFLEFISYKISNHPKGLLKGDLFLLLIFIVPTFFYAAGTSEKGYFALHKSISANSANTTPISENSSIYISENSSIYISENTLVYTSDDLKNNSPANVQNIKNTKISPQKNSSKASSLIARKKLLKNSKALAYTAPQKSSPHKISKIPMSENFFTRHFQTEAAFFIPRVDHLSEAVRTSYLYSRKIPCTLESGKTPNYNTPSRQSVLRLATSIRPPPMNSPYSWFTV
jgi:hypothetical protein